MPLSSVLGSKELPALTKAREKAQRWSFKAALWIGAPASFALVLFNAYNGRSGVPLLASPSVFFAGLALLAYVQNRWSLRSRGNFIVLWLAGMGCITLNVAGALTGATITWIAAVVAAELYATSFMTIIVWVLGTGSILLHFLGFDSVLPKGLPNGALYVPALIGFSAGVTGIALAVRVLLNMIHDVMLQEAREREARQLAEERRFEVEQRLRSQQYFDTIGRVASGVAHDVNNALTVVIGTAEQLRDIEDEHERLEYLEDLKRVAESAAQTTRQLLSLTPRTISRPEAFAPAKLCEKLARSFRRLLPDNVRLEYTSHSSRVVFVDPADLQQALLNLIINARDALPQGGLIELVVEDVQIKEHLRGVAIRVCDNGVGIPLEMQAQVFEPFFTTKSQGRGNGLGLSSAKQFAEDAGGFIDLISAPGKGSAFALYLPETRIDVSSAVSASVRKHAQGRKVLLVEDRQEVLNTCRRTLEKGGYRVQSAPDADAADLLLTLGISPDLLCLDSNLPGMPPEKLVQRFNQLFPGKPVLVCTGTQPPSPLREILEKHRYPVLMKPFSPGELLVSCDKLLEAKPNK